MQDPSLRAPFLKGSFHCRLPRDTRRSVFYISWQHRSGRERRPAERTQLGKQKCLRLQQDERRFVACVLHDSPSCFPSLRLEGCTCLPQNTNRASKKTALLPPAFLPAPS